MVDLVWASNWGTTVSRLDSLYLAFGQLPTLLYALPGFPALGERRPKGWRAMCSKLTSLLCRLLVQH